MGTDPEPPDVQARNRVRDVGVVLTSLGFFGLCFPPPTHGRHVLHEDVYFASALVMLAGVALLALWALLALRARRDRRRRGFDVLLESPPPPRDASLEQRTFDTPPPAP
jgi:hypothetical protein